MVNADQATIPEKWQSITEGVKRQFSGVKTNGRSISAEKYNQSLIKNYCGKYLTPKSSPRNTRFREIVGSGKRYRFKIGSIPQNREGKIGSGMLGFLCFDSLYTSRKRYPYFLRKAVGKRKRMERSSIDNNCEQITGFDLKTWLPNRKHYEAFERSSKTVQQALPVLIQK